ncbi:MAG TPA: ATP-binding protein [Chthonomonadales bacterium]|nr:ATP-binding protein [Chthonomonadales bacterium]
MTEECVLLAVADPTVRRQVAAGLESSGLCAHNASGLREALAAVQRSAVSVLVTDTRLPDGPCQPLLASCRALEPPAECIVIVGPEDIEAALAECEAGRVYDIVQRRSADVGTVARLVVRAAEKRALRRQNAYLLTELRDARDELRGQAEFLVQVERLAAAGQSALAVARCAAGDAALVGAHLQAGCAPEAGTRPPLSEARQAAERCLGALHALTALDSDRAGEETVDANEAVNESFRLLSPVANARGVRLVRSLVTALPPLRVDPRRLQQAIAHVGLNAVHAAGDGGLVSLETERLEGELPGVAIRVTDTGPGMPQEMLGHLFRPFFTTRGLHKGTGLGLAATRTIVRAMRGEVRVESGAGRGTRVTITFPAVCARDVPQAGALAA